MASIRQEVRIKATPAQVFAATAGGSRIVWICDLLPHEMRETIDGMIGQGMAAMKRTPLNPSYVAGVWTPYSSGSVVNNNG